MEKDAQALLLFTNRLLMDLISITVDSGKVDREQMERLIAFSAKEVIKGAPWLDEEVRLFERLTIERLPRGSAAPPDDPHDN